MVSSKLHDEYVINACDVALDSLGGEERTLRLAGLAHKMVKLTVTVEKPEKRGELLHRILCKVNLSIKKNASQRRSETSPYEIKDRNDIIKRELLDSDSDISSDTNLSSFVSEKTYVYHKI